MKTVRFCNSAKCCKGTDMTGSDGQHRDSRQQGKRDFILYVQVLKTSVLENFVQPRGQQKKVRLLGLL